MSNENIPSAAAVEAYLCGRINYERRSDERANSFNFRFETIQQLLSRRGCPIDKYPVIHVAGTKGKGSVVAMIASILRAAGLRTGAYCSPHLECIRERIAIDGNPITEVEFCRLIDSIRRDVAAIDKQCSAHSILHPPTFFEILTVAAFDHFARQAVDAAVIEVGMGGRLDSTNICHPTVTIITNIGLDHQRILGATRALIAAEKAGIVKPAVPLVCGVRHPVPAEVIAGIAQSQGAPVYWLGKDFRSAISVNANPAAGYTEFNTWGNVGCEYSVSRCRTGMIGRHQAVNASIAVAAVQWLANAGWKIDEGAIRRGLAESRVPGRFQILEGNPLVVLDIAHNEISTRAFVRTLVDRLGADPSGRCLIFTASRDKRISRMLALLLPHFERVILTQIVGNPRGVELESLRAMAGRTAERWAASHRTLPVFEAAATPTQAWEMATRPGSCRCIAVTGSAFLVGDILPVIRKCRARNEPLVEQVPAMD